MAALQSENNLTDVDDQTAACANLLPVAVSPGAVLYWVGGKWAVLEPPTAAARHVFTVTDGVLAWEPYRP